VEHEAVANAGLIGIDHETRGQVPKAYVVLIEGYQPSEDLKESIQQHVRNNLAKYQYPREIEFIDELPKTATGKVRRHSLRKREME
jgi:acetyl-CoA synthetase